MVRRSLVLMATMMVVTAALAAGCQSLRQAIRGSGQDSASVMTKTRHLSESSALDGDPAKILAVDSDPQKPKPFFRNSRRSGGLSTEAREIESHLGVGP